ncbi:MAG: hypothetical protein ABH871_05490 [Pseudomonadota bacterium]
MINYINKLNRASRKKTGDRESIKKSSDLPLDHRLTFSPSKDERWTFKDGNILLNDTDVKKIIRECANEVSTLCAVSQGLYNYQQFVWSKGGKENAPFNGVAGSVQHTIQGRLCNLFDGLTDGVHFESDGEDFWINNVNVRSVIKLYCIRPTEAARCYLEGLRNKVGLILSRRQTSTRYDAINEQAQKIYGEITMVLENIAPSGPPRLCA